MCYNRQIFKKAKLLVLKFFFIQFTINSQKIIKIKFFCFLYLCLKEKEHLIFGIRAIIEAIQAGKEVDKVFIRKVISSE
jgi:hypothetical protein